MAVRKLGTAKRDTAAAPAGRELSQAERLVMLAGFLRALDGEGLLDYDKLSDPDQMNEVFERLSKEWGVPPLLARWLIEGEGKGFSPMLDDVAELTAWSGYAGLREILDARAVKAEEA